MAIPSSHTTFCTSLYLFLHLQQFCHVVTILTAHLGIPFQLDHICPDISLFNWVKTVIAAKVAQHCSHSSTVRPQVSALNTENSLIFDKNRTVSIDIE